jgi:glycosyltransferase involved in cell wall biosynthesis
MAKGRIVKDPVRLLWIGDAVAHTGFAQVTHGILDNLYRKYDVHVLGVNYFGDPHEYPYSIYPASLGGDVYGVNRTEALIKRIKPHVVCVLNDPWIVTDYLSKFAVSSIGKNDSGMDLFPHFCAYMPIDGLNIKPNFIKPLEQLERSIFYTNFAKDEAVKSGLSGNKISVIPHGIKTDDFSPVSLEKAREKLNNVSLDWFIVGCINRNQPRKRLDLAVQYFAEFAKDKPDNVKLYYHGALQDSGWDILQLADFYGISDRMIITSPNMTSGAGVPRHLLKYIYSSFDVQISTTLGEGWGLTQMEGMACRVPQIVPRWSALAEWADGGVEYIDCTSTSVSVGGLNTIGGVADKDQFVRALNRFYYDDKYRAAVAKSGYELVTQPKFMWSSVANEFDKVFTGLVNGYYSKAESNPRA